MDQEYLSIAFAALALIGPVLSCSDGVLERKESAASFSQTITGGVEDQGDSAVVGIVRIEGNQGGLCTGTLVAPNLVLTARHCVDHSPEMITCGSKGSEFGTTYSPNSYHVTTAWNGPKELFGSGKFTGTWYKVAAIMVPKDSKKVCGYDVAFLHLVGQGIPQSEATPLSPKVDENVADGSNYRAVGYGLDELGGGESGLRRQREGLKISCVGDCTGQFINQSLEWTGQEGVCQGDSGGPALDDSGQVVGVVSRGMTGCKDPIYGGVYAWREWIKSNGVAAAKAGGYAVPKWAEGGADVDLSPKNPDGSTCSLNAECSSGLCLHDLSGAYCSSSCSDDSTCQTPYSCDQKQKVCVKNDFGQSCSAPEQCHGGQCVAGELGRYCTLACENNSVCTQNSTCESGVCSLDGFSSGRSSKTNACATRPGPRKWSWELGLAALAVLVTRRFRVRAKSADRA